MSGVRIATAQNREVAAHKTFVGVVPRIERAQGKDSLGGKPLSRGEPLDRSWTGLGQVSTYTWLHLLTFKHTWPNGRRAANVELKVN